jgi:oxalate decarboxylase
MIRFALISYLLHLSTGVVAAGSSYLRSRRTQTDDNATSTTPKVNYHVKLSTAPLKRFPGGLFRQIQHEAITNNTMDLAYLQLFPGGVRELHWHPLAAEWGFVSEGTCLITLMNNEGQYTNTLVEEGSMWYFPRSWGHSIYGQDPDVGCTMILSFDYPQAPTFNDLSISQMISYFPPEVIRENLGVPEDVLATFPKQILIVNSGPKPPQAVPESSNPLPLSPTYSTDEGTCVQAGSGGYAFEVRNAQFPLSTTMSGAFMHLEAGTLRDIHWHPNADELQYVLRGTMKVGIYGMGGVNDTYTISAGDVGFVPQGFMHYLEAIDGPVDLLLTFNNPNWTTQELSTWLSISPDFIQARSLNTTVEVVQEYFPKTTQDFYGSKFVGCPATGIPKTTDLQESN